MPLVKSITLWINIIVFVYCVLGRDDRLKYYGDERYLNVNDVDELKSFDGSKISFASKLRSKRLIESFNRYGVKSHNTISRSRKDNGLDDKQLIRFFVKDGIESPHSPTYRAKYALQRSEKRSKYHDRINVGRGNLLSLHFAKDGIKFGQEDFFPRGLHRQRKKRKRRKRKRTAEKDEMRNLFEKKSSSPPSKIPFTNVIKTDNNASDQTKDISIEFVKRNFIYVTKAIPTNERRAISLSARGKPKKIKVKRIDKEGEGYTLMSLIQKSREVKENIKRILTSEEAQTEDITVNIITPSNERIDPQQLDNLETSMENKTKEKNEIIYNIVLLPSYAKSIKWIHPAKKTIKQEKPVNASLKNNTESFQKVDVKGNNSFSDNKNKNNTMQSNNTIQSTFQNNITNELKLSQEIDDLAEQNESSVQNKDNSSLEFKKKMNSSKEGIKEDGTKLDEKLSLLTETPQMEAFHKQINDTAPSNLLLEGMTALGGDIYEHEDADETIDKVSQEFIVSRKLKNSRLRLGETSPNMVGYVSIDGKNEDQHAPLKEVANNSVPLTPIKNHDDIVANETKQLPILPFAKTNVSKNESAHLKTSSYENVLTNRSLDNMQKYQIDKNQTVDATPPEKTSHGLLKDFGGEKIAKTNKTIKEDSNEENFGPLETDNALYNQIVENDWLTGTDYTFDDLPSSVEYHGSIKDFFRQINQSLTVNQIKPNVSLTNQSKVPLINNGIKNEPISDKSISFFDQIMMQAHPNIVANMTKIAKIGSNTSKLKYHKVETNTKLVSDAISNKDNKSPKKESSKQNDQNTPKVVNNDNEMIPQMNKSPGSKEFQENESDMKKLRESQENVTVPVKINDLFGNQSNESIGTSQAGITDVLNVNSKGSTKDRAHKFSKKGKKALLSIIYDLSQGKYVIQDGAEDDKNDKENSQQKSTNALFNQNNAIDVANTSSNEGSEKKFYDPLIQSPKLSIEISSVEKKEGIGSRKPGNTKGSLSEENRLTALKSIVSHLPKSLSQPFNKLPNMVTKKNNSLTNRQHLRTFNDSYNNTPFGNSSNTIPHNLPSISPQISSNTNPENRYTIAEELTAKAFQSIPYSVPQTLPHFVPTTLSYNTQQNSPFNGPQTITNNAPPTSLNISPQTSLNIRPKNFETPLSTMQQLSRNPPYFMSQIPVTSPNSFLPYAYSPTNYKPQSFGTSNIHQKPYDNSPKVLSEPSGIYPNIPQQTFGLPQHPALQQFGTPSNVGLSLSNSLPQLSSSPDTMLQSELPIIHQQTYGTSQSTVVPVVDNSPNTPSKTLQTQIQSNFLNNPQQVFSNQPNNLPQFFNSFSYSLPQSFGNSANIYPYNSINLPNDYLKTSDSNTPMFSQNVIKSSTIPSQVFNDTSASVQKSFVNLPNIVPKRTTDLDFGEFKNSGDEDDDLMKRSDFYKLVLSKRKDKYGKVLYKKKYSLARLFSLKNLIMKRLNKIRRLRLRRLHRKNDNINGSKSADVYRLAHTFKKRNLVNYDSLDTVSGIKRSYKIPLAKNHLKGKHREIIINNHVINDMSLASDVEDNVLNASIKNPEPSVPLENDKLHDRETLSNKNETDINVCFGPLECKNDTTNSSNGPSKYGKTVDEIYEKVINLIINKTLNESKTMDQNSVLSASNFKDQINTDNISNISNIEATKNMDEKEPITVRNTTNNVTSYAVDNNFRAVENGTYLRVKSNNDKDDIIVGNYFIKSNRKQRNKTSAEEDQKESSNSNDETNSKGNSSENERSFLKRTKTNTIDTHLSKIKQIPPDKRTVKEKDFYVSDELKNRPMTPYEDHMSFLKDPLHFPKNEWREPNVKIKHFEDPINYDIGVAGGYSYRDDKKHIESHKFVFDTTPIRQTDNFVIVRHPSAAYKELDINIDPSVERIHHGHLHDLLGHVHHKYYHLSREKLRLHSIEDSYG